jgi:hypothetical protein
MNVGKTAIVYLEPSLAESDALDEQPTTRPVT